MASGSSGGGTSTQTSTSQRDVRTGLPSVFARELSSQLASRFPTFFPLAQQFIPFTLGGTEQLTPETIIQQSLTRGTSGLFNQSISGFKQLLDKAGSQFGGPAGSLATALIQSSPAATLGIANQLNQQNFLADLLRPGASSLQQLLNASALALGRGGFGQEISSGRGSFKRREFGILSSGIGGQLAGAGIGAGAAAAAGLFASDRRLKTNIQRIGTHLLGIGLYRYTLKGRDYIGVMSDEVRTVKPEAVHQDQDGYDLVDYAMIGGGPWPVPVSH